VANIGFANRTVVGESALIRIGSSKGDGGFVETSAKTLTMLGKVNATSAGKAGEWLIDPTDVTISTNATVNATNSSNVWGVSGNDAVITNASIESGLNSGANVTVTTNSTGTAGGNITVNAGITGTGNGSLTLIADRNISLAAPILLSGGEQRPTQSECDQSELIGRWHDFDHRRPDAQYLWHWPDEWRDLRHG
ncbi:hypothetical protein ACIQWO_27195, partial [Pandoraea sp. NPDC090278]